MFEAIANYFRQPPPALDPLFVPWLAALIAGNIIIASGLWALFKYIAKLTPWAEDDKIIQILTGAYGAVKEAVSAVKKTTDAGESVCDKCGSELPHEHKE